MICNIFLICLPIGIDGKRDNYDVYRVLLERLTKMVKYKLIKTTIDKSVLIKIIIYIIVKHNDLCKQIISD